MKRIIKNLLLFGLATAMFTACGDEPEITKKDTTDNQKEEQQNPSNQDDKLDDKEGTASIISDLVKTTFEGSVTVNAATFRFEIENNAFGTYTDAGFCIGTSETTTLDNCVIKKSYEIGSHYEPIVGLQSNTTFYMRSFMVDANTNETLYGNAVRFTTKQEEIYSYNIGTIKGYYFTFYDYYKIAFSKGNLQYQASSGTWRFAEHQYDMVSLEDNMSRSATYSGWIDLFAYGTSGWDSGAEVYQPYADSPSESSVLNKSLMGNFILADWGFYNAISNGGNKKGMWKTPLSLAGLQSRDYARYLWGLATVNDIGGVVILPDNWVLPSGITFVPRDKDGNLDESLNSYSISDWEKMESNGAVFLPEGAKYSYWSKNGGPLYKIINSNETHYKNDFYFQYHTSYGGLNSVRLVQELN